MNVLKKIEKNNDIFISDLKQLIATEDSKMMVFATIFIRSNNDMCLNYIQNIKKDISYGAKRYRQSTDKYINKMDYIIRLYIIEINKFIKIYNDDLIFIKKIMQNIQEKQKNSFLKLKELNIIKEIYTCFDKNEINLKKIESTINFYKGKIELYENIISMCDDEFNKCLFKVKEDFQEVFEIDGEKSLIVNKKKNIIKKIIFEFKNKFYGYSNFSKYFLQKYESKIYKIKSETILIYSNKEKKYINDFSKRIDLLLNI